MRRNITLTLLSLLWATACGGGGGGDDGGTGNANARRAVAAALGREAVLPTYREFEGAAADLVTATEAYAGSGSADDRDAARQAWVDAMAVWQRAELMQVGPAGMGGTDGVAGGRDLRDQIYSWPTTINRCRVDEELVAQDYTDPEAFASELVNVRGLDAMEYLLFRDDFENACSSLSSINQDGSWDALGEDEIGSRRAQYAHTVAIDVHARATELLGAWDPDDDNFLAELETAGDGGDVYPSGQAALNAISDGMFYLDTHTKDMKLAVPAAISMECTETACPDDVESDWAHRSKAHVANNLRGFRLLLTGGGDGADGPLGFDDLLREVGAGDLADDMVAKLDAAIEAVEAIEGTLAEAVVMRRDSVVAAHDAVKAVTDLLKADFITVLDLERPKGAEGDND
ncbi:MAG: imelysin family protein [Polyangiales bacterium]